MEYFVLLLVLVVLLLGYPVLFFLLRNQLKQVFGSLANQALIQNNQAFVDLAKTSLEKFQAEAKGELTLKQQAIRELVDPLKTTLEKYETQIVALEQKREKAYGGLHQYLENVAASQTELRKETGKLGTGLAGLTCEGKMG